MNLIMSLLGGGFLVLSSLVIACCRQNRWVVVAWWLSGVSSAALFLAYGAELLAIVMVASATVSGIAYFFHADTFESPQPPRDRRFGWFEYRMIFPLLVSAGVGLLFFSLMRAAMSEGVRTVVGPERGGAFFPEESFVAIQLAALLGLVVVLGVGVISRPRRGGND